MMGWGGVGMKARFRALSSAKQAFAEATQDGDRLVEAIPRSRGATFWFTLPTHDAERS